MFREDKRLSRSPKATQGRREEDNRKTDGEDLCCVEEEGGKGRDRKTLWQHFIVFGKKKKKFMIVYEENGNIYMGGVRRRPRDWKTVLASLQCVKIHDSLQQGNIWIDFEGINGRDKRKNRKEEHTQDK